MGLQDTVVLFLIHHQSLDIRSQTLYDTQVINQTQMTDEYLTKCIVDPLSRTFYLYSNLGENKEVSCETMDQFMNVLEVVRSQVHEDCLSYSNPL
jgi:hypothetical protein